MEDDWEALYDSPLSVTLKLTDGEGLHAKKTHQNKYYTFEITHESIFASYDIPSPETRRPVPGLVPAGVPALQPPTTTCGK